MEKFFHSIEPEPMSGCWLWTGATTGGYGQFYHKGKQHRAHRLSYEMHKGEVPEGADVCHKCDVRCCVNPDHLFIGTRKDNMQDCVTKGRIATGSRHGRSKLSEDDVRFIRDSKMTGVALAKIFGVQPPMISRVRNGQNWKHVA
jgi:hypothetical protein